MRNIYLCLSVINFHWLLFAGFLFILPEWNFENIRLTEYLWFQTCSSAFQIPKLSILPLFKHLIINNKLPSFAHNSCYVWYPALLLFKFLLIFLVSLDNFFKIFFFLIHAAFLFNRNFWFYFKQQTFSIKITIVYIISYLLFIISTSTVIFFKFI